MDKKQLFGIGFVTGSALTLISVLLGKKIAKEQMDINENIEQALLEDFLEKPESIKENKKKFIIPKRKEVDIIITSKEALENIEKKRRP